jgi:hypothetical protein
MWRNMLATLTVVLVLALAALVLLWPKPSSSVTFTEAPPAAPTSTGPPPGIYQGFPPSGLAMPKGDLPGWRQTFADDFNGDDLSQRWYLYNSQPSGDPGGFFLPSHVSQNLGKLIINGSKAQTPNGVIYATGGISNSKVLSQVYGKFDIRFRMDAGYGINFVLLLWPTDDSWPPEINIAEDDGLSRSLLTSTLHYRNQAGVHDVFTDKIEGQIDFTQWHTVGVEWTPGHLKYFIDGRAWTTVDSPYVPSTPMSLAIQSQAWYCGGYFSDCPNATTPTNVNLEVDWAVAYQMA